MAIRMDVGYRLSDQDSMLGLVLVGVVVIVAAVVAYFIWRSHRGD